MTYRKTWSHEVWFDADSNEEAIELWEGVKLGELDKMVTKKIIGGHDFIEDRSFEDEDYNDVEE